MEHTSPPESANLLLEEAETVIRRVVKNKLRVTLGREDYREQNLDAFDLLGDVRLKLVRKLNEERSAAAIEAWTSYAATVAYNCCADYLRAKYPHRTRLSNALRRLLEKSPGYAVWPAPSGELLAGFAGLRNSEAADSVRIAALRNDPAELRLDALARQSFDTIAPKALLTAVEAILDHVKGPIPLDDMIAILGRALGVEDTAFVSDETSESAIDTFSSPEPGPESQWLARERLKLLWGAVLQLLPWHRAAYLLNLRDGELDAFPYYGVASIEQIGESLDLKDSQFEIWADEAGLDPMLRSQSSILAGSGQKFMIYWRRLPLEDKTIARILGVERSQIIAYRNKAIERLRRQLKGSV